MRPSNAGMEHNLQRPALPVFLQPPTSITLSGLRIVLDQRGWPRATIAEGPVPDDQNRLALYVAAEFEEPIVLPQTKQGTEWLHLAKARHDLERAGITDLSGNSRFGEDPPDFYIGDAERVAVELAQFTHSRRRETLSLLRAVKQAVIRSPRADFEHLRDRLVLLGFEDSRGFPPRASDKAAIQAVLDTLRHTAPGPEPRTVVETINPHEFVVQIINSTLGLGASACFPLPLLPQSELANTCGFEIAASLTVMIRARDTEEELGPAHDRPRPDRQRHPTHLRRGTKWLGWVCPDQ